MSPPIPQLFLHDKMTLCDVHLLLIIYQPHCVHLGAYILLAMHQAQMNYTPNNIIIMKINYYASEYKKSSCATTRLPARPRPITHRGHAGHAFKRRLNNIRYCTNRRRHVNCAADVYCIIWWCARFTSISARSWRVYTSGSGSCSTRCLPPAGSFSS